MNLYLGLVREGFRRPSRPTPLHVILVDENGNPLTWSALCGSLKTENGILVAGPTRLPTCRSCRSKLAKVPQAVAYQATVPYLTLVGA